jgi:DNA-3-methyladenine glycosylase II
VTTVSDAILHIKRIDPILGAVMGQLVPTFTPHKNYYQELVESIISQQLSVKAASAILKRFVVLCGNDGFPTPQNILKKDIEQLRSVGLSRQKAGYIQDLAIKVIDGTVRFDHLDNMTNKDVIEELTEIKGVGIWTVHMFLMFCMGRLDVLPVGDLGIKNGIQKLYGLDHQPTPDEVTLLAAENHWHPYESVASWYVWQSLNNVPIVQH